MGSINKLEHVIVGAMLMLQLALMLTADPTIAAFVPPLLAALPVAFATMRSEQTVRLTQPRPRRAFVSVVVLAAIVAAFHLLAGDDLSFKLQVVRVLLTDALILWFAIAVAVARFHPKEASR